MKKLSLALICAAVLVFVVGIFAPTEANPDVEVVPIVHNFGDVELSSSSTTVFTITNLDFIAVTINEVSLQQSGSDFSITLTSEGTTLGYYESADVQVTFSPSAIGVVEATLIVGWVNAGPGATDVEIIGTGVEATGEPVSIQDILDFFEQSVTDGSLVGSGLGNSASGRLKALRNMLEAAGDLIDGGFIEDACYQLQDAYDRCDGESLPPDFVTGPALEGDDGLPQMILDLMAELGCDY
jgi:hypothetical protein